MKTLLLLTTILLSGCDKPEYKVQAPPQKPDAFISTTPYERYGGYCMTTLKHDNHWFILWDGSQKGGLLHHPDCPCGKK
jgi:hypothetical protein